MASEFPDAGRLEFERRLLEQNIQTAQVLGTAITMRDHGTGAHNLRLCCISGGSLDSVSYAPTRPPAKDPA